MIWANSTPCTESAIAKSNKAQDEQQTPKSGNKLASLPMPDELEERKKFLLQQVDPENFDLTRGTADEFELAVDYLCATLLFGTDWEKAFLDNPRLRKRIPSINDLPLVCQAEQCPYAKVCPVLKAMPQHKWDTLIDTRCRADQVYATEMFAEQIRSLRVQPKDTPDIVQVAAIVRFMLLSRRVDWELAIHGLVSDRVDAMDQKAITVYFYRSPSELLKEHERLTKLVGLLQGQLMSTRRDRAQLEAQNGNRVDGGISDMLRALRRDNSIPVEDVSEPQDVIDPEFQEMADNSGKPAT